MGKGTQSIWHYLLSNLYLTEIRIEIMLKVKQGWIALIANIFVSLMMYLRAPKQTFTIE